MNKRDDFTKETIDTIASRVGYKCSNPNCRIETRGPHTNSDKKVSIGEAAHIKAAAPGGPRYDSSMTKEERKSAENGIWLCRTHARMIDSDEQNYPVELLRAWKAKAEYEQYCILNNKKEFKINYRHDEALRIINKELNEIHNIYTYLKKYYDMNLSRCYNFIHVQNEIMENWELHGREMRDNIINLNNKKKLFQQDYLEYELDISDKLKEKIDKYFELTFFNYQSDGIGLIDDYYENFFRMLIKNYSNMSEVMEKIKKIIKEEYSKF